ncbi:MAG: mechanosensitive ion channel [Bacteroidetes bacterium]|nr:mechanosensitive ion channel [Bacteroidota bacterium]
MQTFNEILKFTFLHNTVENYLWFFGIILLAIVFKRLLSKRIMRLLLKLFTNILSDSIKLDTFLDMVIRPLELLIVTVAVYFAFNTLNYSGFDGNEETIKKVIHHIFQILIVVSSTWIALSMINFLGAILQVQAEKTETKVDDQIILFAKEAGRLMTYVIAFLFILSSIFELNVGSLIAGLGIGGLAIALAAQDTLENLIASFVIFADQPFQVGDFIKVGDTYGVVEKIGFRSTRIRTLEKSYLTVPNKTLINKELDNLSLRTFRRAKYSIGVTYDTNIDQIQKIVADIQKFIDDHKITNEDGLVRFEEFADSSLNIMVLYYVRTQDWNEYMLVREEVNYEIMRIVKKHGSDFAFPTQTIHLEKE